MKKEHLNYLICPICRSRFEMSLFEQAGASQTMLICTTSGHEFPVRNGIPRFVDSGNYAESFGFQWQEFSKVQMDSYNGTGFSEQRFQLITGWEGGDLAGKLVLDAGCGAGRFAEVALKFDAELVAFDLSEAVDVARGNLSPQEPLICQASIYQLPFPIGIFDYVYCIGVVQHTPDPAATVRALCQKVKPGGKIGLWIYERDWKSYVGTLGFKYTLRPMFRGLTRSRQYAVCKAMVSLFFPIASMFKSRGFLGRIILRLLPIASAHIQSVPLSSEDFKTWVPLDTFDMYSPAYDKPQTFTTIAGLLAEAGFENIQRHPHGGIAVTATRKR